MARKEKKIVKPCARKYNKPVRRGGTSRCTECGADKKIERVRSSGKDAPHPWRVDKTQHVAGCARPGYATEEVMTGWTDH